MRRSFARIFAFVRRDALATATSPLRLLSRFVALPVSLVGFYYVAKLLDPGRSLALDGRRESYFAYVCLNLVFILVQTTALQAFPQAVRGEQLMGALEPILTSPISPAAFFVAGTIWPLLMGLLQAGVGLAIATAFLGLDLHATNVPALVAFVVLGALAMGAIGLVATGAVIAFRVLPPTGQLVGGAGGLLAGSLFPVAILPPALQFVSYWLPLTHALRGLRGAVAGESLHALGLEALWLVAFALVAAPLGYVGTLLAIERARATGTLGNA